MGEDYLLRLPPELRLMIYGLLLPMRRDLQPANASEGSESLRCITNLLTTSKYIHLEASDLLYGSAVFKLTPAEVSAFSRPTVFCKIKRIRLMCDLDLNDKGPGPSALAQDFIAEAAKHASHAPGGKLGLSALTMSFVYISDAYKDELSKVLGRPYPRWGGPQKVDLGQSFTIYLEERVCARMWVKRHADFDDDLCFEGLMEDELGLLAGELTQEEYE